MQDSNRKIKEYQVEVEECKAKISGFHRNV